MVCKEADELISALVDNELSAPERQAVQGHLNNCADCRTVYEQERDLKRHLHALAARVVAPAELRQRILADTRIFPETAAPHRRWLDFVRPARVLTRPAFALALLLLLILPVYYLMGPDGGSVPLAALGIHAEIENGELPFGRDQTPAQTGARLAGSVGGRFSPMGYDLSAAGLRPVGGMLYRVNGRAVLVAVYRGEGPAVTCFTFLGTDEDAPPRGQLYVDAVKKINYYTFTNGSTNGVMHREGERICLMVSNMPMEKLLTLVRSLPRPRGA